MHISCNGAVQLIDHRDCSTKVTWRRHNQMRHIDALLDEPVGDLGVHAWVGDLGVETGDSKIGGSLGSPTGSGASLALRFEPDLRRADRSVAWMTSDEYLYSPTFGM